MKNYIEQLSCKEPEARRQALIQILEEAELDYTVQSEDALANNPQGVVNYILEPATPSPSLLFCAHYDAVPGSVGANDNAAAVSILINLACELKNRDIPARFAFFDGEENNNAGSRLYVSQADSQMITGAVNLDLCGYGDTLAIYGKGNEKKASLFPFCEKNILKKHNGQMVKYLPPSDDVSFAQSGIPAISIAIVPYWDIKFLKVLESMGGGMFGRTPEFNMTMGQMEVITTIHGGQRDAVEYIDPDAMNRVYQYLLDGILTPAKAPDSLFHRIVKK